MDLNQLAVNTLRVLSAECIDKANSGHPGIALGAAPIAYSLFSNHLTFNPQDPAFDNRDRFVLSAGHGSMLYYSLLHLFGYKLTIDDLKNFRQLNSKTPGHPEVEITPGIEVATGPLGQGVANAVGMAIAERHLAAKFNRENFNLVDHYTYVLCGDGCMEEGIEYEAAALAGALKLNKLIVLYDKNDITIEGNTALVSAEDVGARHVAQGWNVINVSDGNNLQEVARAITKAKKQTEKPSLIICQTEIGFGSPWQSTAKVHGSPLGEENIQILKENLGWTYPPFTVPEEIQPVIKKVINKGKRAEKKWKNLFKEYESQYHDLALEYKDWMSGKIPEFDHSEFLTTCGKKEATRASSSNVLNFLADKVPNLFGGSADLGPSNLSVMKNREYFSPATPLGSNVHYGIREHAMAAISNGIARHGGLIPYCSTFFVFSDYMKNSIRLSALMDARVIYILTHDSIGVGEDGPTHQPIEHLAALRSIPNLNVYRPADATETFYSWIRALKTNGPSALILSRQGLEHSGLANDGVLKGGYIIADSKKSTPDCLLIASGSEVEICLNAKKVLEEKNIDARVISIPCMELFEKQTAKYKESVLPQKVKARVCIEAGTEAYWHKYAGSDGAIISINQFGQSAPAKQLYELYGLTVENVCEKAIKLINKK